MKRVFAVLLICWVITPLGAWNSTGHRAIALLAWEQLTPQVKNEISRIMAEHPQAGTLLRLGIQGNETRADRMFANGARWPDDVRNPPLAATFSHPDWHYINIPYVSAIDPPPPDTPIPGQTGLVLKAIATQLGILADQPTALSQRAIALCWVAHLVGDIHQPLHAIDLYSSRIPVGDKGGNKQLVRTGETADSVTNLHWLWDFMLGADESWDAVDGVVARLRAKQQAWHPNIDLLTPSSWANESRAAAIEHVHLNGTLASYVSRGAELDAGASIPILPAGYLENGRSVADERAIFAAARLAMVLNRSLQ